MNSFQTLPFRIIVAGTPATRILYLSGKLNADVASQVADQCGAAEGAVFAENEPAPRLIFDLQGVEEFDAAGVKQLTALLHRWREAGADLFLVAKSESVQSATGARFAQELIKAGAYAQYTPTANLQTVLKLATFRGASFKKLAG